MSKVSSNNKNAHVERKTTIEKQDKASIPLVNGCFVPIIVFALMIIAVRECKRSGVRLEQEKIKLEHMKDGTWFDTTPVIKPDTLKMFGMEKTYIPMSKFYKNQNQK